MRLKKILSAKILYCCLMAFFCMCGNYARAGETGGRKAIEKLVILIEPNDIAIGDKELFCQTLADMLLNPKKAPWGVVTFSYASCNPRDKEFQVQPYERWRLRVISAKDKATWLIQRYLNPQAADKQKSSVLWKIEASQVLKASQDVREGFYEKDDSLRILLAGLLQQLPFFQADAEVNNNQEKDLVALPAWSADFRVINVCLSDDWKLFQVYLFDSKKGRNPLCQTQYNWKVSLKPRGSLTKQIEVILLKNLKNIKEEVIYAQGQPKPLIKPFLGLALQAGWSYYLTNLTFGDLRKIPFAGLNATLLADYYKFPLFVRKKTLQANISLGVNWHSLSSPVYVQSSKSNRTLNLTSIYARVQAGINVDFLTNYRLIINPFFDYGLLGKYMITGNSQNSKYGYSSSMQYGTSLLGEYRFKSGSKVGLGANVVWSEFSIDNQDSYSNNKKIDTFGFSEFVYFGWNI